MGLRTWCTLNVTAKRSLFLELLLYYLTELAVVPSKGVEFTCCWPNIAWEAPRTLVLLTSSKLMMAIGCEKGLCADMVRRVKGLDHGTLLLPGLGVGRGQRCCALVHHAELVQTRCRWRSNKRMNE